ncbi:MAG TPA: AAA family ATPase, partial [Chloroflexota bacterium]|nr:AAA family ATPase [Chloroflexota bacterium]
MRIARLDVNGFGRLCARQLTFSPSINVIAGPNESGKSTLAEAMQALLFGLTDDAKAPAPNKLLQHFRPWAGGLFGGSLWVELENGERYRVVRDFATSATKVYREPGTTDVTRQYTPGKHGWINFADQHLGMSRAVFRISGWIDPAQLTYDPKQSKTLKERLEHLAGAPEDGVSAPAALDTLSRWLKERVNSGAYSVDRSPYLKERELARRLRAELEQSRAALESLDQLVVNQREIEAKLRQDQDGLARLAARLAAGERAEIQDRLARLAAIEDELTTVKLTRSGLDDVANLEPPGLLAAENALTETERGRCAVEVAQKAVSDEDAARAAALRELQDLNQELVQIPEIAEQQLTTLDGALRRWDTADQRFSEAERALTRAREQLQARESAAAAKRAGLPSGAHADAIRLAIQSAQTAAHRLSDARADLGRLGIATAAEAEFDRLDEQLGALTAADLGELEASEPHREQTRPPSSRSLRTAILVGLAALIGLGLGFALLDSPGAAAGAILGGAIGFVIARALARPGEAPDDARMAKNHAAPRAELRRYGVESARELRVVWDRRNELASPVTNARAIRARVAERQGDLDRATNELARVSGTPDLAKATTIEQELRQDQTGLENLRTAVANAELAEQSAASELVIWQSAARKLLASLNLAAESPAQAYASLTHLRAGQERRRELLQRHAALLGNLRLYAEHEDTLAHRRQEFAKLDTQLSIALENAGLALPLPDPAAALQARRARFERYQALRNREQNLDDRRRALTGGEDPLDWRRRAEALERVAEAVDTTDARSREELEACRAELQRKRDDHASTLSDLRARADAALAGIRPPAVIEEELAEAERRYAELERLKNALEGARETLGRVAEEFR